MKIKFKFKDKSEIYEGIYCPRRYHIRGKTYLQFIKAGKFVRVYVNKEDKWEVEE